MNKTKILVTGANGQLGHCIKAISEDYEDIIFVYKSASELNIIRAEKVLQDFESEQYDYCINCAAYTNVDKAEEFVSDAMSVNAEGAKNLAVACEKTNSVLIHISTDFVFDGTKNTPYIEEDKPKAIGSYGASKLEGEKEIIAILKNHFIIRTSWLYSEYAHNFMKSMVKYGTERDSLSVVFDQIGTPTYAKDLAKVILNLVKTKTTNYGLYHYSNEGVASWYDFAKAIFDLKKIEINLYPIKSTAYPLPAKRPSYSVLDKTKIKEVFNIEISHWRDSLTLAINALEKEELIEEIMFGKQ